MNFRILSIVIFSFALSLALCAIEIPLLKKLGAGQNILSYVKEHEYKSGTPSMGGLGFILAAVVAAVIFCPLTDKPLLVTLAVGIGYMLVGFLDDVMKKIRGKNLGLRAYQKIFFQLAVAVLASVYACVNGLTVLKLPFSGFSVDIGWWALPFGIFLFLAAVNSVNLTDGLDGLAGSTCSVFFAFTGALLLLEGVDENLALLSFALVGALGAYLCFNTSKASVFMGDTGSLSLGGFVACVMFFSGNALFLPLIGIMFVVSSISVIVQVIYYKKTGKRVFLMAPIHHHFQQKGYSEAKIAAVYSVITAVMGIAVLLPLA